MIGRCHVFAPMMYDLAASLLSMLPTLSSPSAVAVAVAAIVVLLTLEEEEEEEVAGHHHEEGECEFCKSLLLLLGCECDGKGEAAVW